LGTIKKRVTGTPKMMIDEDQVKEQERKGKNPSDSGRGRRERIVFELDD
jgi:hypothetical protein